MNLKELPQGDLAFGRRIWWADPDKSELIELKISSDNTRFFFVRRGGFTYELSLLDLIKTVNKEIDKRSKKKK